ncbi:MAG: LppX_LprAFG lipoprotein [Candidatus Limnocylindrales bacterium]|jgi:hypothetical protein
MIRLPRSALALLVGLVVVFASACSSSGSTFPALPSGGGPAAGTPAAGTPGGGTPGGGSPGASVAATANTNDPESLISQINLASVTSFHVNVAISGTIKASGLASAMGSSGGALTGDLTLDGTTIDGDVDVANQAAHLTFSVPAMPALGGVPLTGDLIVKDSELYYKISLLGDLYTKTDLSTLTGDLGSIASGVTVPTPGPSALSGVTDEVAKLREQLKAAGVTATLVGVEQVDGKDAYHISISVPMDALNGAIASAAPSAAAELSLDSATVDLWTYKDNYQLAKVQIQAASSTLGTLGVVVTVTNYNTPVTITAPPDSEIQTSTP